MVEWFLIAEMMSFSRIWEKLHQYINTHKKKDQEKSNVPYGQCKYTGIDGIHFSKSRYNINTNKSTSMPERPKMKTL